jgi:hypothetical protein
MLHTSNPAQVERQKQTSIAPTITEDLMPYYVINQSERMGLFRGCVHAVYRGCSTINDTHTFNYDQFIKVLILH